MAVHKKRFVNLPMLLLVVLADAKHDFQFVSGETRCKEGERRALLGFKQGLIDDHGLLSSWGSEGHKKECCKWNGVHCGNTTNHVIALKLGRDLAPYYYYNFRGNVSSTLLELHYLNEFDLSYNDFGGIRIPEFIASMKSLQHLDLSYSNFLGSIPPQLGNLTNLRTLDLSYNQLWSDDLYWMSRLSFLSRLNFGFSIISDTKWVQHVVLNLPSLQVLQMSNCALTDETSARLFLNLSSSISHLDLSYNPELAFSTFDWFFNMSKSLVSINLSYNKQNGPIPDVFGRLISLQSLDLSNNMYQGGIPRSFANLSRLQQLNLFGNELGVPVEELLGNLSSTRMMFLDLSNTQLTGSVSVATLGQFSKLQSLNLSYNSLQGTISGAHFIKLVNLKRLSLSSSSLTLDLSPDWVPPFHLDHINLASCKMGPFFPTWLKTQRNVKWLDLSNNGISDEVPKWFWSWHTYYLNISHNQISGTIPDLSSNAINTLDVRFNKFSGPLPFFHPNTSFVLLSHNRFSGSNISSSICTFAKGSLLLLDLSNNQLTGKLPNCWENMTELRTLNLNSNNFSGEIPHTLGYLSNLVSLHLWDNSLSGELPSTLKYCQRLKLIDIGGNKLTGNIPPWLGGENYSSLTYLSLRQNRFYGGIPPDICKLTNLQMLDLSGNIISGKIPPCFNSLTSLVDKNSATSSPPKFIFSSYNIYCEYASVQWKHRESEYRKTLELLKLIDLSSNKLVGNIPKAFSSLRGLVSLNLSRNSLTGSMDPNIGEMEMLECLDLSKNQLSGEIPIGLTQLHYLAVLDLANNNLSGKIPSGTQLQSFDASVYTGNNDLCGPPLMLCLNTSITDEGENIEENDSGFMRLSFMHEFGISMAFGVIVGFWGVVGSLILKKSWRSAYFNLLDVAGDWFYVTVTVFLRKFKR